jgi:[acyl-carrier-protein] S-malonyltransferase
MKTCMLFPGYESQSVGMGKELYDTSRIMQELFEEANACLPINFVKLCFASSDIELAKAIHAYPSIFLISVSLATILAHEGIVPDAVAGYGIGEYAAMHVAGGLSFPDGLYLLTKYAALYQELLATNTCAMARISGIPAHEIQTLCSSLSTDDMHVFITSYETTKNVIIGGHMQGVGEVCIVAHDKGATTKEAPLEIGLHSTLMASITQAFKMYLEKVDFKDTSIPIITSSKGTVINKAHKLREQVVNNIEKPIRWDKVLAALQPYDLIIEIGPGTTLKPLVQARYPQKQIITINKSSDITMAKQILAKSTQSTE